MKQSKLFDEQALDFGLVGRRNDGRVGQIAFLFGGFLGEDVAFVSVFPLDLSGAGEVETLLGSGVGFHLRHFDKL